MTSFVLRWFPPVVNNAAKLIYAFEKKRLLTSQLRVSSTQITRYKSRKTGGLDAFDSQHLGKYADDLLHLLEKRRDPLEKEIKKWKNDLSGVLFQYSQRGEEPLLLALFRKMTDLGQANEASYTILMRYYADCDDYDKVKYYFEHMENSGVLYHGRSYVPLIVLSLKMNKLDETELYFNQLLQNSRKMFVHNAFVDIIDACADLREETGAKDEFTKRLVDQALHMMERYGSEPLEIDATETLLKWFNRFNFISFLFFFFFCFSRCLVSSLFVMFPVFFYLYTFFYKYKKLDLRDACFWIYFQTPLILFQGYFRQSKFENTLFLKKKKMHMAHFHAL